MVESGNERSKKNERGRALGAPDSYMRGRFALGEEIKVRLHDDDITKKEQHTHDTRYHGPEIYKSDILGDKFLL